MTRHPAVSAPLAAQSRLPALSDALAHSHQIVARNQYVLRTVVMHTDLIGLVLSGTKHLLTPQGRCVFATGEYFILPRGTHWDVVNDPAPHGRYIARVLSLQPETIARFHHQFGQFAALPAVRSFARLTHTAVMQEAFLRAADALADERCSAALREHRLMEVLLLLAEQTATVLAPPGAMSWRERVRRLVSQRPYDDWSASRVAQVLATTPGTLNRRLAQESCTITACVRNTRLEAAMMLLQSSDRPVAAIARDVGYASHSKFSAAFRRRFGVVPSALRD